MDWLFSGETAATLVAILGAAVYMAAVAKFPKRNIRPSQGARIIKQYDGEPTPDFGGSHGGGRSLGIVHGLGARVQPDAAEEADRL